MTNKHEFRAESRHLLDLMINSIYTNKEIFLRELISNASDAIDKLRFEAARDGSSGIDTGSFEIKITLDKEARLLTLSDNGIGMNADELSENLGVIAASGTGRFKAALNKDGAESENADFIGRFGVGFYSAFMVADHITVISKRFGDDTAYRWDSDGVDGYTVEPDTKEGVGTDIRLHIREDIEIPKEGDTEADDASYGRYLREYQIYKLVKKYSDYIRYPIKMFMPHPVITNEAEIEAAKSSGATPPEPEFKEEFEYETLNSMIPLWQRPRGEVTKEEFVEFYKEHFSDKDEPMSVISASIEGNISYKTLLFIPARTPSGYGSDDFKSGLELYSSGVLIMNDCRELLPEEFNFVCGVVDSSDLSLNISREMLQQNRDLTAMSTGIAKKIKSELLRILKNERDKYLTFYRFFGHHLKVCAMDEFGAKKDFLGELLLFYSKNKKELVTLDEYIGAMPEEQKFIYYASGDSVSAIDRMPQIEVVSDHGFDILYFMDKADEFVSDMFRTYHEKAFKSVTDGDIGLDDDSKKINEERYASTFDFILTTLNGDVDEVHASSRLKNHPVCLTSGSGVTFEMEKYFKSIHKDAPIKAKRILELNVNHPAFMALDDARLTNPERAAKYCRILLNQAKMIAGLPIEDPAEYTDLIVSLW